MKRIVSRNMSGLAFILICGMVAMLPACTTGKSAQTPATPVSNKAPDSVKKVVWHVDFSDPVRLGRMLTSVNNMLLTYEEQLADHDIHIVFLGAGIRFLTSDPLSKTPFAEDRLMKKERKVLTERLDSAMGQGIKLELCKITVNAINLNEETVLKGVGMVPSGVGRIAELQHKGYAYLKAD